MKTKLSNIFSMLTAILIFVGCNSDNKDPKEEWPDKSTVKAYISWMEGVSSTVVDNLDFLFQASAYRDSLKCGGDAEYVLRNFFSNPNIAPPQFDENGEICSWVWDGEYNITHNGISLGEDGAEWIASGNMNRFWNSSQQPNNVQCQWKVSRQNGEYTLNGNMIYNGLWEEFFTMINMSNVTFTTSFKGIVVYYNGVSERKRTLRYCFDGDVEIEVEDVDKYRPDVVMVFDGLTGNNPKWYVEGIPVFDGRPYFEGGKIDATILDDQKPWRVLITFTPYGTSFIRKYVKTT